MPNPINQLTPMQAYAAALVAAVQSTHPHDHANADAAVKAAGVTPDQVAADFPIADDVVAFVRAFHSGSLVCPREIAVAEVRRRLAESPRLAEYPEPDDFDAITQPPANRLTARPMTPEEIAEYEREQAEADAEEDTIDPDREG